MPFDRLTVLSKVEGLTTQSQIEGQYRITKILMIQTGSKIAFVLVIKIFGFRICFGQFYKTRRASNFGFIF